MAGIYTAARAGFASGGEVGDGGGMAGKATGGSALGGIEIPGVRREPEPLVA